MNKVSKQDIIILMGDMNAKVRRENKSRESVSWSCCKNELERRAGWLLVGVTVPAHRMPQGDIGISRLENRKPD